MKNRMLILALGLSSLAITGCAAAHGSGYPERHDGGLVGSVTVWSSPYAGVGYAGSIHFAEGHYGPSQRYRGGHYYPACGHWHPRDYRPVARHAYRHGYDRGYYKGHRGHGRHHRRHHRHHH